MGITYTYRLTYTIRHYYLFIFTYKVKYKLYGFSSGFRHGKTAGGGKYSYIRHRYAIESGLVCRAFIFNSYEFNIYIYVNNFVEIASWATKYLLKMEYVGGTP